MEQTDFDTSITMTNIYWLCRLLQRFTSYNRSLLPGPPFQRVAIFYKPWLIFFNLPLKWLVSSTVKVKAMMMTLFKKSIAQNTTQFPFARKLFLTKSNYVQVPQSSISLASMPIDLRWKIKGKVAYSSTFPVNLKWEGISTSSFLRHSKMYIPTKRTSGTKENSPNIDNWYDKKMTKKIE